MILYANGATLEEVGEQLGVTRERARQIINKQSPVPTADIRSALATEKTYYATWRELCEIDALEKWSTQNIGIAIERAEVLFNLPIAIIRKRLGVRHKFHPSERKAEPQGYSDAELLSLLRQFHEETGSTVSAEFERWSTNQGGPTRQPLMIRFGTWNNALREAGIDDVEDIVRDRLYTDRDCWACVIEYLRRAESDYTFADFSEWVTADVYRPSPATVRNRLLVRWSDMVETGLAVLAGRQTKYGMRWAADVQRLRDWRELVTSRDGRHDHIIPVDVLREACEELGVPLTTVRYDEWSQATEKPRSAKLTRISGKKWNDLLIEAGIPLTTKQARKMADEAKKRATILPGG
ncbi:homing endonuclease associated repeat-containing protein [Trueperella pecoris]|uniref:homing endonuclease associated repeat-containing protein n=1 Tax=Trueperella pecoris TaxID=2733571 RepID=UPI00186B7ECD|nr:sigma factor-like helix-turn-helix DNA-binding protein [Trueperella pecoris]QOQ39417.1 hypothetical protein HLG82_08195 [Trueperella pecoris]